MCNIPNIAYIIEDLFREAKLSPYTNNAIQDRNFRIVLMRWDRGFSLRQIAGIVKLNPERIRQIEAKVLRRVSLSGRRKKIQTMIDKGRVFTEVEQKIIDKIIPSDYAIVRENARKLKRVLSKL